MQEQKKLYKGTFDKVTITSTYNDNNTIGIPLSKRTWNSRK